MNEHLACLTLIPTRLLVMALGKQQ